MAESSEPGNEAVPLYEEAENTADEYEHTREMPARSLAATIEQATFIQQHHHHYGGVSRSGGYTQIADDIFINAKKPLREGKKIYEGYQKHVTGQRQPLAIKAIIPCSEKSIREVQHLVRLSPHPNVVQIIRSKQAKTPLPALYIAMELCSSQNLKDYLNENREKNTPFNFKKTMSYSKGLIKGIRHIHRNRIIHGDLKPENILFTLDEDEIKVSDFGISKQLKEARTSTKKTSEGTDGYRAPETYNSENVSRKADIFSLGLTLYSLFTNGKHPFGKNLYKQVLKIMNNAGREYSDLPKEMGAKGKIDFLDLLDKMLKNDCKKRPTIEEVSEHPFFSEEKRTGVRAGIHRVIAAGGVGMRSVAAGRVRMRSMAAVRDIMNITVAKVLLIFFWFCLVCYWLFVPSQSYSTSHDEI